MLSTVKILCNNTSGGSPPIDIHLLPSCIMHWYVWLRIQLHSMPQWLRSVLEAGNCECLWCVGWHLVGNTYSLGRWSRCLSFCIVTLLNHWSSQFQVTSYLTRLKMLSSGSAMAGLKERQALQQSNSHGKYGSGGGRAARASSDEGSDDLENKVRNRKVCRLVLWLCWINKGGGVWWEEIHILNRFQQWYKFWAHFEPFRIPQKGRIWSYGWFEWFHTVSIRNWHLFQLTGQHLPNHRMLPPKFDLFFFSLNEISAT